MEKNLEPNLDPCIVCGEPSGLSVVTSEGNGFPQERWCLCTTCLRAAIISLVEYLKVIRGTAEIGDSHEMRSL